MRTLPTFRSSTVDERLKEFRSVEPAELRVEALLKEKAMLIGLVQAALRALQAVAREDAESLQKSLEELYENIQALSL